MILAVDFLRVQEIQRFEVGLGELEQNTESKEEIRTKNKLFFFCIHNTVRRRLKGLQSLSKSQKRKYFQNLCDIVKEVAKESTKKLDVGVPLNADDVEVSKMADPGMQARQLEPGNHKSEDPVSRTTSNDRGL